MDVDTRRRRLVLLRAGGYNVPMFGKCSLLALTQPRSSKVLIMSSPMHVMQISDAAAAFPEEWAVMFVGQTPGRCIRVVQVGRTSINISYENIASWRADEGKVIDKWVASRNQPPAFPQHSCYSIDFINGKYAVNLKTEVGLTSLGIEALLTRKDVVREIKPSH